jgi:cellulose synthase/poly-beta-1,6-N-acetylglucosamine synthase-like glycosyltransferase
MPCFSREIIDNKMIFCFKQPSESASGMRVNCFPGGASVVRREVFDGLGLCVSGIFVGFEDYEMAIRVIRARSVAAITFQDIIL